MIDYNDALTIIRNKNPKSVIVSSFELDDSFVFATIPEGANRYSGCYYSIGKNDGKYATYNYWKEYYSHPDTIVEAKIIR